MTIPNPDHLFEQAEALARRPARGAPRQVDIRRSISSTYYGLFHFILARAADQFAGGTPEARASKLYVLVYRSIDHKILREICSSVVKPSLPEKLKPYIPNGGFDRGLKSFAATCLELQEKRHDADYNPALRFRLAQANSMIASAKAAIEAFRGATGEHQELFVALLLFKSR